VGSNEPTEAKTFEEYGLRFDIEENLFDDYSNGFELELSLILYPPWPQKSSIRDSLTFSSLWNSKMPSRDSREFGPSTSPKRI
jgi:hypothetical protein